MNESPAAPESGQASPRDAHFGGHSYEASLLRELLAVIHRDGGHYVAVHGIDKATEDALKIVADAIVGKEGMNPASPTVCARCNGTGEIRSWGTTPAGHRVSEVDDCPACKASPTDGEMLDWLEAAYTDGAINKMRWAAFMTMVAHEGIRAAIARAMKEQHHD